MQLSFSETEHFQLQDSGGQSGGWIGELQSILPSNDN
jgi:hypothetical protein